jgi:hypothetical protein
MEYPPIPAKNNARWENRMNFKVFFLKIIHKGNSAATNMVVNVKCSGIVPAKSIPARKEIEYVMQPRPIPSVENFYKSR